MLHLLGGLILLVGVGLASARADDQAAPARNTRELWADFDPRADALEIEIAKSWEEGLLHIDQLYFTGETWLGKKVRVFAYRAAPAQGEKLPGILHIHGGG